MARGGYRPNSGRPKGTKKRPQLRDFLTDEQVQELISKAYEMANDGDSTMLKFILEQVHGKAAQTMDVTSLGESVSSVKVEVVDAAQSKGD